MPYRPLTIPERDFLFALYDKYGGNRLAMTRDPDCVFKSYAQLTYYCRFHHFQQRMVETRRKRAEEVIAELGDAKTLAIERAMEMMRPRQVALRTRRGDIIVDADGQPMFDTIYPSPQEVRTAWEIIKTEMGEATSVSKTDITSKGKSIAGNAIAFIDMADNQPEDDPEGK